MKKKSSPYFTFMSPYLERGNDVEIQRAKKVYRAMYKKKWKTQKRKVTKYVEVAFTEKEYSLLTDEAKRHHVSRTKFIHLALFAYLDKRFIVPDEKTLKAILQSLMMIQHEIENREEDNELNRLEALELKELLYSLEKMIRVNIVSPYTIQQLLEKEIRNDESYKSKLLTFIQSL